MAHSRAGHSFVEFEASNTNLWYRMIKGSLAETIVRELFLTHKYSVLSTSSTYLAEQAGNMPDYVIQHLLSGETYFVEVKFSADEYFSIDHLRKDYPDEDALIIVVSNKHIKCLSVKELRNGMTITPRCSNYLADRPEFELRRDVVGEFCRFTDAYPFIPNAW